MALEDVELDARHTPRLENDNSAGDEGGVVDENFEERRISIVETVEVDAFNEYDGANEARGGPVFVPVQGERKSLVERTLEFCNVAVDYCRSFRMGVSSVQYFARYDKVANTPESGSNGPAYSI